VARKDGWEWILASRLNEDRRMPFVWGERDCALWAADCVMDITGIDYAAPFRGQYNDEAGAKKLINEKYNGLCAYVDAHIPTIPVAQARRGDVVFYNAALGVCFGRYSHFVTYKGLAAIPTSQCERAWRID
jgi:hypothetical protein